MKTIFKSYTTLLLCCVFAFAVVPLLLVGGSNDAQAAPSDVAAATSAVSAAAPDAAVAEPVDAFSAIADWLQVLSLVIAACAAIAAMTPTPKDDGIFLILRRVIDFLALNFGHAKNVKPSEVDRRLN